MNSEAFKRAFRNPARGWTVLLCLTLFVFLTSVQTLHFHSDDLDGTAKPCTICTVLNAVSPVILSGHLDIAPTTTAYVCRPVEREAKSSFESPSLFSRPPPSA
ncbi:MAG TPA: hypothetical protein VKZ53_28100 [Candidatus Angelobacter sp.]|nr:hypothetical protein [Candidatus Angelobacter sp.]